jgi:hypothetical protein
MIYSNIIEFNSETGTIVEIPVTNEWVLENRPNVVTIQLSKGTVTADGVDSATMTVQLKTPLLIDGTQSNVNSIVDLVFSVIHLASLYKFGKVWISNTSELVTKKSLLEIKKKLSREGIQTDLEDFKNKSYKPCI